jgi:hypothetical protein
VLLNSNSPQLIIINVTSQELHLVSGIERLLATWPVSTSKFGLGSQKGSFCTPLGKFRISEKIGDGAPKWMIFKNRVETGTLAPLATEENPSDEDLVLTRILWLEGIDPANINTKERYIYIHGTNQEALIGHPASHGCIRLRNNDMLDLFERVEVGCGVEIKV